MKRRFKSRIEAKKLEYENFTKDKAKAKASKLEPEMPHLPEPRPYALTPSSSVEDLGISPQNSTIFEKLPPEIRREILILAFGNRTVHMDLVFNHPLNPGDVRKATADPCAHGGAQTRHLATVDVSRPRCWQWRGCVCHRNRPPYFRSHDDRATGVANEPGEDTCLTGYTTRCSEWTYFDQSNNLQACLIGAMGWLLACRQAYTAGVQVLYSTNTIHLSSKPLLTNISTLILPQRLSAISALEVVWSINTHEHLGKTIPRQDELNSILSILDKSFPHISRLHLGINLVRSTKELVKFDEMMKTLDSFVSRRTDYLREPFEASISSSAYNDWYYRRFSREFQRYPYPTLSAQVWRNLNGEYTLAPFTLSAEGWAKIDGATAQNGYWFVRGDKDEERYAMRVMSLGMISPA